MTEDDTMRRESASQSLGLRHPRARVCQAIQLVAALALAFLIIVLPSAHRANAATFAVTNCNDSGAGSLRQVIAGADSGDTVTFALQPECSVISLTNGGIELKTNLVIDGPGSTSLTIDGNGVVTNQAVPDFTIDAGVTATISGLRIIRGGGPMAPYGGGIANHGNLTVEDSAISQNDATGGSGIYSDGSLTIENSVISDNSLSSAIFASSVDIENSSILDNSSVGDGGGLSAGSATVSNTVIEGNHAPDGGGILAGGVVQITDSTVADNSSTGLGGGIAGTGSFNGSLAITGSTFTGNSAATGGAIFSSSPMTIDGSTISGNSATSGGGVYNSSARNITITNSSLSNNNAIGNGGGLYNGAQAEPFVTLGSDTFSGNSASQGGAIFDSNPGGFPLDIKNSTLAGNSGGFGGGLYVDQGSAANVFNSTLSANTTTSATSGGDLYVTGFVQLAASIVAGAGPGLDCAGTATPLVRDLQPFLGYNLDDDGSCGLTASSDLSDTDPLLDPSGLQDNGGPTQTVALQAGSPAIGFVSNSGLCPATDERGVVRTVPCDIGAYEGAARQGQTVMFTSPAPTNATVGGPGYAVSATGGGSGNPVTFQSDTSSVCTVSGSTVSFVGVGTCTVEADQAGNADYLAGSKTQSFSVGPSLGPCGNRAITRCFTSPNSAHATVGRSFSFRVTTAGTPAPKITKKGKLPKGVKFFKGTGSASLGGTPTSTKHKSAAGSFRVTFTATYGTGKTKQKVTQNFTLTVAP